VAVLDVEGPTGTDLLATCRELGVALIAAMPLGRGLLTSTFASGKSLGDEKDKRTFAMPRLTPANRDANEKVINQFKALADKKGCSTSQLAIAWLLKQGDDIIPIPGTKRTQYLEENWRCLDISISDEEDAEIRHFAESMQLAGGTLPPAFKHYEYRDTKEES